MCAKASNSLEKTRAEMSKIKIEYPSIQLKALYFDLFLQNIPDDLYFKDLQSRFTMVNQAWMKRHNVTNLSSVIGKTDFDFFLPAWLKNSIRMNSRSSPVENR